VTIATGEERLEELVAEFSPAKDAAGTPAQATRPRATAAGPSDDLMRSRGFICHGRAFFAVDQARVESFGHLDSLRRMPKVLALVQEMAGMARGYNEDYREALTEGAKHFTLGKNRHRRMVSARMGLMAKLLEMSRQIFAPGSPLTVVDKPKCLQAMAGVLESVGEGGDDFDTVRNLLAKNFVQVRKLRMMPDMDLRLVKDEEDAPAEAKPSRGLGGGPPASVFPSEVEGCLKTPAGASAALAYLVEVELYRRARERMEGMEANWRAGVASAVDLDRAMQEFGTLVIRAVGRMAEAEARLKDGGFANPRLLAYLRDPVQAQLIIERYASDPAHAETLKVLEGGG
jgi:hypothetical protein